MIAAPTKSAKHCFGFSQLDNKWHWFIKAYDGSYVRAEFFIQNLNPGIARKI